MAAMGALGGVDVVRVVHVLDVAGVGLRHGGLAQVHPNVAAPALLEQDNVVLFLLGLKLGLRLGVAVVVDIQVHVDARVQGILLGAPAGQPLLLVLAHALGAFILAHDALLGLLLRVAVVGGVVLAPGRVAQADLAGGLHSLGSVDVEHYG